MSAFSHTLRQRTPKLWRPPKPKRFELWFHTWIGLQAVVAVCSPHADDSEFLAAVIRWLTDLGVTVYNLLFWPGYRCPGLADVPLDDEEKTVLREKEFEAACIVTRARPQMLRLHGYEHPEADYRAGEDENTITRLFAKLHPRLVILPPFYDSTPHARTRELVAIGMVENGLHDCQVLTFDSPWNPLGGELPADLYFPYEEELALIKDLALSQYASQTRQLDYVGIARRRGDYWAKVIWELAEGHHKAFPPNHWLRSIAGCEAFRCDQFDAKRLPNGRLVDPIQLAFQELKKRRTQATASVHEPSPATDTVPVAANRQEKHASAKSKNSHSESRSRAMSHRRHAVKPERPTASFLSATTSAAEAPMFAEIMSQADVWEDELQHRLPRQIADIASRAWFASATAVDLVGIGSSANAATVATCPCPRKPTRVQPSTLFRPSGDLVVAISASGETTDTLDAVQCAKDNSVRVIGVTSNRGSTLAKLSDANILLTFPKETSIPATVSMTTSLLALKLFLAARDGRELPGLNELAAMLRTFIADQRRPASTLAQLVSAVGDAQYVAVLGDGAYMGVASEIALKIRETAGGVICEAANLRDYRHGPVEVLTSPVLADAGLKRAAILIEPEVARPQKNLTFFSELADQYRGGAREFTLVRLSAGCTASTDGLVIPDAGEFTPLFGIVLGQMLAYELALAYGIREPGASDVLTKVVVAT